MLITINLVYIQNAFCFFLFLTNKVQFIKKSCNKCRTIKLLRAPYAFMATANGAGTVGDQGIDHPIQHTIQPKLLALLLPL